MLPTKYGLSLAARARECARQMHMVKNSPMALGGRWILLVVDAVARRCCSWSMRKKIVNALASASKGGPPSSSHPSPPFTMCAAVLSNTRGPAHELRVLDGARVRQVFGFAAAPVPLCAIALSHMDRVQLSIALDEGVCGGRAGAELFMRCLHEALAAEHLIRR